MLTFRQRSLPLVALGMVCLLASSLFAQTQVTVDFEYRGWMGPTGSHTTGNHNYFCGYAGTTEYRNFLIFDLANVTQQIVAAELRMDNPVYTGMGDYTVYEVNQTPSDFWTGLTTSAHFDDAGSGTVVGVMPPSSFSDNPVIFDLNADGVAYLNSKIGQMVVIGGRNTVSGTVIFSSTTTAVTHLVLTLGNNDAPVVTPGTVQLTDIDEDPLVNDGDQIDSFIYTVATDPDGDDLGIAIIDADQSHGQWEYSIDGGSTWHPIGNVAEDEARLVADDGFIRFVPNPDWYGTASIEFRAWDQFMGTNGDVADTTNHGGSHPYSTDTAFAEVVVHPVNDAPQHGFPSPAQTFENKPLYFTGAQSLTVSDIDIYNADMTTRLTVSHGVLSLPQALAGLITSGANESASFTIVGHIDDVNAALAELSWLPETNVTGTAQLEMHSDDGGATGQGGPQQTTDLVSLEVLPAPDMRVFHGSTQVPHGDEYAPSGIPNGLFTLSIRNQGSAALNLTGNDPVSVSPLENAIVHIDRQPSVATITAGGETTFVLRISGEASGPIEFSVSIDNDDPLYSPYTFVVTTHSNALTSVSTGSGCAASESSNAVLWLIPLLSLLLLVGGHRLRAR